jgi:ABC-2 type transport system permease protein
MTAMLRDAWFLAHTGIRMQLRARETLLWTFVMPLVFMFFIGNITGNAFGPRTRNDLLALDAPTDAGELVETLITKLRERNFEIVRPAPEKFADYDRRLTIPAGFTESVRAGRAVTVRFERTGEAPGMDLDRLRVSHAIDNVLAGPVRSAAMTLDVRKAGRRKFAPSGFDQTVPGTMVMFTLLVLFTSGAVTLTIERRMGLLRRLASSPISRGGVVLGRWGSRMALGAIQIAFAMAAGTLLFHVHWGPNLPMVAVVLLSYGALAAALGMLLGNFGHTESQVIGTGVLLSNLLAGLGGCWWPIEIEPAWAQKLAILLPTGWTMDAMHKLVNFGRSPVDVLPHVAASIAATAVIGWILARSFRFE